MTKCNKIIKVYVPGRDLGLVDSSHCFNDLQLDLTEDKLLETRLGLKSLRLDLNWKAQAKIEIMTQIILLHSFYVEYLIYFEGC